MQTSSLRCAFWFAMTSLTVAACTSSPTQPPSGLSPNAVMSDGRHSVPLYRRPDAFIGVKMVGEAHPDHHKSWISPDVGRAKSLYFAADFNNEVVYIFTLPKLTLKATLTGFSEPQGECADKSGNVWVANTGTSQVIELSHTGSIINTIDDSYGAPVGCAVNPKNGAIAVTNFTGTGSNAGEVLVFATASSTPTVLTNPSQYYYYLDGYDSAGNLRVDGRTAGGTYILSACGKSTCSTVKLTGGTIWFPGAVQWDNLAGNWVVFDQECGGTITACSYPVSASGVLGTPTHYLNSKGGQTCDMVQGTIATNGKSVVGSDFTGPCYYTPGGSFNRWVYSAGGKPTKSTAKGASAPAGSAISTK